MTGTVLETTIETIVPGIPAAQHPNTKHQTPPPLRKRLNAPNASTSQRLSANPPILQSSNPQPLTPNP